MKNTILLVEDSHGDALLIQDMFSGAANDDFSLEWVESLTAAFERLKTGASIAAVLLDLSLPDGYGFQTVHQMISAAPQMPIIILTGLEDEALAIKAVQAGAQDYLVKGQVQQHMLLRAIRYAIQRKQEQEKLRASETRYRLLAENISDVVFTLTPDFKIADVTPSVTYMLGYQPQELVGIPIEHILTAPSLERVRMMLAEEAQSQNSSSGRKTFWLRREELEFVHKNGDSTAAQGNDMVAPKGNVWTEVQFSRLPEGEDLYPAGGLLGVVRDMTERRFWEETLKQANETLSILATRDPLTGLYNRRYMVDTLDRELQRALRENYPIGLIIFDIDNFKAFNDHYGHVAGDLILVEMGELLRHKTRHSDVACRYGGEEFLILMPNASPSQTFDRAETIRKQVKYIEFTHHGEVLNSISVSAGVSGYPYHGKDVTELISAADGAMYRAKAEGRDRVMMAAGLRQGTGIN
jgi:two-component system, cell cycle response regulator